MRTLRVTQFVMSQMHAQLDSDPVLAVRFHPIVTCMTYLVHLQVRIQDFVKGGAQLLRPKVANVAKWSHASEASP